VNGRVLIVDDDRELCAWLGTGLAAHGFATDTRTDPTEALAVLREADVDVVVTDLNMRSMHGLDLCASVVQSRPDVPVLVITAFGSLETAIGAIRAGAYDFITKPFEIEALVLALERAIQHRQLRDEVKRLRRVVDDARGFGELLGTSPAMARVYDLVSRVADSEASVLVTGESGTGKELVARALHRQSRRANAAFVAVDCAAVPENLLESELFGHARGAFTDARGARTGLFLQAHAGTLFLDEIGDLPLPLQPKLLRALQERVLRPVGADREVPFDVRLVAATNQDLEVAVEERRFREDLFFRINVIHVELPPLRARGGDVLVLAQHFVVRAAERAGKRVIGIAPAAAGMLLAYPWPGNVRELQNCIERAVALSSFDQIGPDDLPDRVRNYRGSHVLVTSEDPSELVPLEEVERRYILRVLEALGGNKTLAARTLGLDRKTLYRKLERWGPERA
jgi:two-component system, NtrC family, response regulator AtoC